MIMNRSVVLYTAQVVITIWLINITLMIETIADVVLIAFEIDHPAMLGASYLKMRCM